MTLPLPLLSGFVGAAAGWLITKLVDHATVHHPRRTKRLESILSITVSALLLAALALRFKESGIRLIVYSGLVLVLVGVTVFDIRTQIIPHVVTIPGSIFGLISGSFILPSGIRESMLGLLLGGGVLLLATLFEAMRKVGQHRAGLGDGDSRFEPGKCAERKLGTIRFFRRSKGERHPQFHWYGIIEVLGHDSDDGVNAAVQRNGLAQQPRVTSETSLP